LPFLLLSCRLKPPRKSTLRPRPQKTRPPRKKNPLPLKPARKIEFTSSEGTWLSLDVSPDGQTIIFDLVGDLYTVPISGGTAKKISKGMAFNAQPHYSPDGKKIAYINIPTASTTLRCFSGNEHSMPITPLFDDVIQFWTRSGIFYTPTFIVAYGGPWAENYYYETTEVHDDPKVRHFLPHNVVDDDTRRRQIWTRKDELVFPRLAAEDNKLIKAGGRVLIGSHGQFQGLGYHWEMWSLASGGVSNRSFESRHHSRRRSHRPRSRPRLDRSGQTRGSRRFK
jgi:WD40-like Beta Propeller Repeat